MSSFEPACVETLITNAWEWILQESSFEPACVETLEKLALSTIMPGHRLSLLALKRRAKSDYAETIYVIV